MPVRWVMLPKAVASILVAACISGRGQLANGHQEDVFIPPKREDHRVGVISSSRIQYFTSKSAYDLF